LAGQQQDARASKQNSQAAQTVSDLFAPLHHFRDSALLP
jgi:hypothetical protein